MPLGTILLGIALLIIVVVVIALPLLDRKTPAVQPPSRREALEQERRTIISAIRELDFDYRTGKIDEEDYKRLRESRVARGAQILRELAELDEAERDVDAEIEAQVARFRTVQATDGRARAKSVICSSCGHAAGAGDKFCPQCGHPLDPQKAQAGRLPARSE
ncbi:MAG: zinc ribbon domain-containing protein [Thermoflexales bacterium]|nr:zinc ribbon domain-containing protein [Thermoflexales bacterium]MDW8351643.1 zinc-ribbon domain-containing protein [Anaerolineae bacterium]